MNILGISGLHFSQSYQREQYPDLNPRYHRMVQGMDSAAALIIDGVVVASAAEERFTREKGTGAFPLHAIRYCLKEAGITFNDLDIVAHGFNYEPYQSYFMNDKASADLYQRVFSKEAQCHLLANSFNWSQDSHVKFMPVGHHLAHAASSYYLSGFNQALVVVIDGMGETESLSIMVGEGNTLRLLHTIPDIYSLGILYSLFTVYLGFDFNSDEYKVMGLASYGDPNVYIHELMDWVSLKDKGTYTLSLLTKEDTPDQQAVYGKALLELERRFGPSRKPGSEITSAHYHIAAAVQAVLEKSVLHVLKYYRLSTKKHHLCLSGGVALNCCLNAYIRKSQLFDKIYIQPAAGDDGTALGAALYASQSAGISLNPVQRKPMPYLGPGYDDTAYLSCLQQYPEYTYQRFETKMELYQEVAEKIASGHIMGWFQGRMEYGPRALGNRSILADPRDPDMRARLNLKIKQREDFRPFAPSVLIEDASTIFDIDPEHREEYRYMLSIATVKPLYRTQLPSITHVDGSARVHVVSQEDNPMFWGLLHAFKAITGVPVLINTSFNVNKQPIVCTPRDALETLELAGLDYLVLGHYLIKSRRSICRIPV